MLRHAGEKAAAGIPKKKRRAVKRGAFAFKPCGFYFLPFGATMTVTRPTLVSPA
jgi:hypothetical protein